MLLSVLAGAILFFTYLVLATGRAPYLRIDRTGAAIVGATLMIATGVISLDEAYGHIDFRTLVLLFGMMVLIAHLRMARFFSATVQWIAVRVQQPTLLLSPSCSSAASCRRFSSTTRSAWSSRRC
jgi:Na+/H+ antiporter NhaD/arsenite permease-like protein